MSICSSDISDGIRSSTRAMRAAEDGLKRVGNFAANQTLSKSLPCSPSCLTPTFSFDLLDISCLVALNWVGFVYSSRYFSRYLLFPAHVSLAYPFSELPLLEFSSHKLSSLSFPTPARTFPRYHKLKPNVPPVHSRCERMPTATARYLNISLAAVPSSAMIQVSSSQSTYSEMKHLTYG